VPLMPCGEMMIRPFKFKPWHKVFCHTFIAAGSGSGVKV